MSFPPQEEGDFFSDFPPVNIPAPEDLICRRVSLDVFRDFDPSSGLEVVVKRVDLDHVAPSERCSRLERLQREALLMTKVSHPNLLQCYSSRLSSHYFELFLEPAAYSLASLTASSRLSEDDIISYFTGICRGLEALHSNGMVHRDLKGDNVVIAGGMAKIADFGEALQVGEKGGKGEVAAAAEAELRKLRGTVHFMAPEALRQEGDITSCFASDIWSLGATLFEMVYRQTPFYGHPPEQVIFNVGKLILSAPSAPFSLSSVYSEGFCHLVEGILSWCFAPVPAFRPTASDILDLLSSYDSSSSSFSSSEP